MSTRDDSVRMSTERGYATLSVEERNRLRTVHVQRSSMSFHSDGREREVIDFCDGCLSESWPCPVVRLLDDLDAIETIGRPMLWQHPRSGRISLTPYRPLGAVFERPILPRRTAVS
jgi:hypothetical protein